MEMPETPPETDQTDAGDANGAAGVTLDPPLVKRGPGRPPKYRRWMCGAVIELGKLGKSKAQMALALDVSRQGLDDWAAAHPEFLDAVSRARDYALAWWDGAGQRGITQGKDFNAAAYAKSVNARFADVYRDRQETVHSGSMTLVQAIGHDQEV